MWPPQAVYPWTAMWFLNVISACRQCTYELFKCSMRTWVSSESGCRVERSGIPCLYVDVWNVEKWSMTLQSTHDRYVRVPDVDLQPDVMTSICTIGLLDVPSRGTASQGIFISFCVFRGLLSHRCSLIALIMYSSYILCLFYLLNRAFYHFSEETSDPSLQDSPHLDTNAKLRECSEG